MKMPLDELVETGRCVRDERYLDATMVFLAGSFVRGEGTVLWDSEGKRYLDFLAGLAVVGLGHAHPEVAEAIGDQARTLLHVSNLFGNVDPAA